MPSSALLCSLLHSPCSSWSSPCLGWGNPWASWCSLWKVQSSPLKGPSNLLKEADILLRVPGNPWVEPGSLWCSLCVPQTQALCRACSLKREKISFIKKCFIFLIIIPHRHICHSTFGLIDLDLFTFRKQRRVKRAAPVRAISASTGEAKAGGGGG